MQRQLPMLRSSTINKTRSNSFSGNICCLEVSNSQLCKWYQSSKSVAEQLNNTPIGTEVGVPVKCQFKLESNLEKKLLSRARSLMSSLSKMSRRKKEKRLQKSILIDIKESDITFEQADFQATLNDYR